MSLQEGGKVASGIVDALRNQPMVLALVLFNLAFLAIVYFSVRETRAAQNDVMKTLLGQISHLQEMLAKCGERSSSAKPRSQNNREALDPSLNYCQAKCYAGSPLPSWRPPHCSEA